MLKCIRLLLLNCNLTFLLACVQLFILLYTLHDSLLETILHKKLNIFHYLLPIIPHGIRHFI